MEELFFNNRRDKMMMLKKFFNKIIVFVNHGLTIITLGLFIALVVFICHTLFTVGFRISLTTNGVLGLQKYWLQIAPLIKAFIAFLTLTIASIQLKRYIDLETITALAKLRELLITEKNMEIHNRILNDKVIKNKDSSDVQKEVSSMDIRDVDIYNYLGTLELGAIMVKRNTITIKEFETQFGYRIKETMNNAEILTDYVNKEPYYYTDLIYIWEMLSNN